MLSANLPPSDLTVSRVGFGCWAIGGHGWGPVDDNESIAAIRRSLELGITFFDVADVYGLGHAEEILAKGLGSRRNSVVLATKFGVRWESGTQRDVSPRGMTKALEGSLRRLRVEQIPLYQIHWPDGRTPIADTMEALARCKEQGKIGWIGCCNFSSSLLREALDYGQVVSIQAPYSLLDRGIEQDILPASRELGVGMICYGTLAQGMLSGRYDGSARFTDDDVRSRSPMFQPSAIERNLAIVRRLSSLGSEYGRTSAQVAIRWILDVPGVTCALTGIKSIAQIEENADIDWNLSAEDHKRIEGWTAHTSLMGRR